MSTAYNPSPAFREAADYLSNATALNSVSNATKLELYAIYKYLTVSPTPNTSRPSIFDFTGRAKWDAWQSAGETYKDRPADAENRYLDIARSLGWTEGLKAEPAPASSQEAAGASEEDIWDSESETAKHRGNQSGMAGVMSTMTMEDEQSASALSNFAISGNVQGLLSYLQEHPEVDVNARDENGYTSLHLAADRGHAEMVRVLLGKGADREIKDQDEFTAKELAEVAGHDEIVHLLSDTHNPSS
ncbi:ankyrin [Trametes cingulata]|nr:ankyrin [Trametes cingulata]